MDSVNVKENISVDYAMLNKKNELTNLNELKTEAIPFVSVIMPVYNAELYLLEAIESILGQTYTNFEFLIFDDGSTDKSIEIIKSYNDSRIKLFSSPENMGHVTHLNKGIELSKGKYFAQMHADDISLPTRLQEQIEFMEKNPEIGVCGTWVEIFGLKNYVLRLHTNHEEMIVQQLYFPPFIHPSVMIRKKVLCDFDIKYKEEFLFAEDYEIWVQLAKVTKFAIVPKLLLKYRTHELSVSAKKYESHIFDLVKEIRKNQYERLLERKLNAIEQSFIFEEMEISFKNLSIISVFFREIKNKNNQMQEYQPKILNQFLNERIIGTVSRKRQLNCTYLAGIFMFPFFFSSVFFQKRIYLRAYQKIKNCFNP